MVSGHCAGQGALVIISLGFSFAACTGIINNDVPVKFIDSTSIFSPVLCLGVFLTHLIALLCSKIGIK